MCFLLYKPEGSVIKSEWVINAHDSNSDGFGLSYKINGKLFIQKGLISREQCLTACNAIPKEASALIHFRFATHGSICEANCHPFVIGAATCAHNGMLSGYGVNDSTDSEDFMRIHKIDTITKEDVPRIEGLLGTSKMVLLRPDNEEDIILNEKHGFWLDDCWHSNHSALSRSFMSTFDEDAYHLPDSKDTSEEKVFALINAIEDALPYLTRESKQAERLLEMLYTR